MRVRWTEPAVRDFTQICDYIEKHGSKATARRVALSICQRIGTLAEFPEPDAPGESRIRANLYSAACLILLFIAFITNQ